MRGNGRGSSTCEQLPTTTEDADGGADVCSMTSSSCWGRPWGSGAGLWRVAALEATRCSACCGSLAFTATAINLPVGGGCACGRSEDLGEAPHIELRRL